MESQVKNIHVPPPMNTLCLYTIILGNYETSVPFLALSYFDCILFSDNVDILQKATRENWITIHVHDKDATTNPRLYQRHIKSNPHLFLPVKYDSSLYIDSNCVWKGDANIVSWVERFLREPHVVLYCFEHPLFRTIQEEMDEVLWQRLASYKEVSDVQKKIAPHFRDDQGHTETNILFRKHWKLNRSFSEEWFQMISLCGRDQISFDYLLWKHGVPYERFLYGEKPIQTIPHSGTDHYSIRFSFWSPDEIEYQEWRREYKESHPEREDPDSNVPVF